MREQKVDRSPDEILGGERASDAREAFVGVDGDKRVHDIVRAQFVRPTALGGRPAKTACLDPGDSHECLS
ncbi:hypothetical protein GCM10010433_52940 [Streptomyces pulveraceus]